MGTLSDRAILGMGTPEDCWRTTLSQSRLARSAVEDLVAADHCLHVLAPHPDDEVLGCGGIIRQVLRLGRGVNVWSITDGEASHPGSTELPPDTLAQVRTRESQCALRRLGQGIVRYRLRIPDGTVRRHLSEIAPLLAPHLRPGDTVIAPWRLDGHPDHEAVVRAGQQAAASCQCRLFEIPIWGWHWVQPCRGDFTTHRALVVSLTDADILAKARAIRAFCTQLYPDRATGRSAILPDYVLVRFQRPYEVLLR